MNPIQVLVKWRLDNLKKELDFITDKRGQWKKIQTNLVFFKYILNNKSDDKWYYYAVIKNIIWKNIINYEIKYYTYHHIKCLNTHMLYNNYRKTEADINYNVLSLDNELLLNLNDKLMLQDNLNIMQLRIINYITLIDKIVTDNLILDLIDTIKWYIFDVMLMS